MLKLRNCSQHTQRKLRRSHTPGSLHDEEETLDDIINRLRKLKDKKAKKDSPLEDFFEPEEIETTQPESDIGENGLDIKPLGKSVTQEEAVEQPQENAPVGERPPHTNQDLAKGIRELSFDDLEETSDDEASATIEQKTEKQGQQVIELSTQDPKKIKHLRLIVALLEAEQYEAARQEIDNMITI